MDLQLSERQATGLAGLSTRTGRSASELAAEAVDRLLTEENWFESQVQLGIESQVQLGIDQIARGEFLEEEEMDARVARMMRA